MQRKSSLAEERLELQSRDNARKRSREAVGAAEPAPKGTREREGEDRPAEEVHFGLGARDSRPRHAEAAGLARQTGSRLHSTSEEKLGAAFTGEEPEAEAEGVQGQSQALEHESRRFTAPKARLGKCGGRQGK